MKIVVDNKIPGVQEGIAEILPDAQVVALEGARISRADVVDADALIVRTRTRCDATLLEGSNVKWIGTATIGTDHIDISWCEAHGIRVTNAPGCNAPAVVQYVAASLAAAGFNPEIDTLGIVGKGHIGSLLADLYRRRGTKVLVCDTPRAEAGFTDEDYLPLHRLLEMSDAVTFHVPYTASGPHPTHHLLTGKLPERPGILVNSSRGNVFNPEIILREGEGRRLIIDTWPFEDAPSEYDEATRNKMIGRAFIATPHIAGYSVEGKRRATDAMLTALRNFAGSGECVTDRSTLQHTLPELDMVISSFNPGPLSAALKAAPDNFEALRGAHLRPEPAAGN